MKKVSKLYYFFNPVAVRVTISDFGQNYKIHWNLIITLMLGSIRNQCYNRIVL